MSPADFGGLAVPRFGPGGGAGTYLSEAPPGSAGAAPNVPAFGGLSGAALEDWLRDCGRALSRSMAAGDPASFLQASAPWAAGRASWLVVAAGEDAATLAARLFFDAEFVRGLNRVLGPCTVFLRGHTGSCCRTPSCARRKWVFRSCRSRGRLQRR